MPTWKIIQGDCLEAMKTMPDCSVDAIVTDPPYGLGLNYDVFVDTQDNVSKIIQTIFPEMLRVSKRIVLTCGHTNIWHYPPATWVMAWIYGTTNQHNSWGFTSWQPILCYGKDPYLAAGKGARMDIINDSHIPQSGLQHPCPKPISFMKKLVLRCSANEGDTILDPFMGSGSTGVAALQTGRNFIGIEISTDYCAMARRRLQNECGLIAKEST